MTILLTGATGFIGFNLLKRLCHEQFEIIALIRNNFGIFQNYINSNNCKLYDLNVVSLKDIFLFNKNKIDIIIHCAVSVSNDNFKVLDTNIKFSLDLFQEAMKNDIIFMNLDTTSYNYRNNLYSISKKIFRKIILELNFNKVINLPIEIVYGKNENRNRFVSSIIYDLLDDKSIKITEGVQKRNFIYIEDLVSAIILILKKIDIISKENNEIYLASDDTLQIKEVVLLLKELIGGEGEILFGEIPYTDNEKNDTKVNNKFLKKLGWRQGTALRQGFLNMINEIKRKKYD